MPPEPSATIQKHPQILPIDSIHQESKYGLIHQKELASGFLSSGRGLDEPVPLTSEAQEAFTAVATADGVVDESLHRLSFGALSPTGFPGYRVSDHGTSTSSVRETREGSGSTMVHREKPRDPGLSTIQNLPNEVLTHILSHLPPQTLSDVSLVSRWFHALVTSPHSWRLAFSRLFPGPESLDVNEKDTYPADNAMHSERRNFTRLTSFATWRSEYILRPRLLLSLARGKPAESEGQDIHGPSRSNSVLQLNAQVTYSSCLVSAVSHLHANFQTGALKQFPRLIHGDGEFGSASLSEPIGGQVDNRSLDDRVFSRFSDHFPGDSLYGLDAGNVIGVPNSMDASQPYGVIYAEGFPGGIVYLKSVDEKRGRSLAPLLDMSVPEIGIPQLNGPETMCAVWIAKTANIPDLSGGLVGLLTGSSHGIVSSYSLGTSSLRERRLDRGELTARWVLSPGVPIIAIAVDDNYSSKRHEVHRIWAVVINALGEVYYVSAFPERPVIDRAIRLDNQRLEHLAWETGRTVYWDHLKPTGRIARPDPYHELNVDDLCSPRTSSNGMGLSKAEIYLETGEIERLIRRKPAYFRKIFEGWDMRRRLEVDYASIRESIIAITCGLDEGRSASIKRFTRCEEVFSSDPLSQGQELPTPIMAEEGPRTASHAHRIPLPVSCPKWSFRDTEAGTYRSTAHATVSETAMARKWHTSVLRLSGLKTVQITTTAMDLSNFAVLAAFEDPLLVMRGLSTNITLNCPPEKSAPLKSISQIPGQRGRFMAAGTNNGIILIWNIREPTSGNNSLDAAINPVRIIRTASPQISSLALSALYLVHGGDDGLVQAWDPLASSSKPIRTLNSRLSRARRRLMQAESTPGGATGNRTAAGAICLDSDPTVLRGMVSIGTQLRYWSYRSSAGDQYKGNKRRRRRSEREHNQSSDRFSDTGRGTLKDYITNERLELEREKMDRRKREERMAGRFGLDLLGPGANEAEILAYAALLSKEAAAQDEERRKSGSPSSVDGSSIDPVMEAGGTVRLAAASDEEDDADIAEAIRRSLEEINFSPRVIDFGATPSGCSEALFYPIRHVKSKRKSPSASPPNKRGGLDPDQGIEVDDLELALRMSLAEDDSPGVEKGKGKARLL